MSRVWLVTGASAGLGEAIALKALEAGDRVIATSRSVSRLERLKSRGAAPLALDHNQSQASIQAAVDQAIAIYGTIDVVVNNAAYVQLGTLEETTQEETQTQFLANVFGPLNLYRAILPHMRAKRSGTLCTIGSMAAWYFIPGFNLYDASKAAIRAIGIALGEEVEPFGIKHCLVEPGFFRTELLNPSANVSIPKSDAAGRIKDYREMNAKATDAAASFHGKQVGDPVKGAGVIFDVMTGTGVAEGKEFPRFIPLGKDAVEKITKSALRTVEECKRWETVVSATAVDE